MSAALFEPPPFQPTKLSVQYLAGARPPDTLSARVSRRYTLTHNDITGALNLSIGLDYNQKQIQGFYTRILRDEITAEWYFASGAAAPAELHVYCHVSGEERWLAPPQLRNFIFRREMTLVSSQSPNQLVPSIASNHLKQLGMTYPHCETSFQQPLKVPAAAASVLIMPWSWRAVAVHLATDGNTWLQPLTCVSCFVVFVAQVLDTFYHADAEFLQRFPDLMKAKVYVHFQSDVQVCS